MEGWQAPFALRRIGVTSDSSSHPVETWQGPGSTGLSGAFLVGDTGLEPMTSTV